MRDELTYFGARNDWQLIDLRELWKFRELIWAFGFRDLKVRYRQAVVGIAWAVIQPVMTIIVFGVLFSVMHGKPTSGEVPYAVTGLCGLVPWQFFAAAVSQATLSIASNSDLLKKVYFPRVVLPLSAFVPALVDFAVALVLLVVVMAYFAVLPSWQIVFLPLLIVATLACAAAFALWLSALNGIYRDVQFALPFLLQLGMMICPVVYETDAVIPPAWQPIYYLNPLAGLIQCYRAVLIGSPFPSAASLAISSFAVTAVFFGGMLYFRRMERHFADLS